MEDYAIYRLLWQKAPKIGLVLKYVNSCRAGGCVDVDSEIMEQRWDKNE